MGGLLTKKNIITGAILVSLVIAIPLGTFLVKNQTQLQSKATVSATAGDADGDGCVGIKDYQEWLKQKGQTGEDLTADFDNSGTVNEDDYNRWLSGFQGSNRCSQ